MATGGCAGFDSPVSSLDVSAGCFRFEDFEGQLPDVPGVTSPVGDATVSTAFGPTVRDTVDEEVGPIDGSGLGGGSLSSGNGPKRIAIE